MPAPRRAGYHAAMHAPPSTVPEPVRRLLERGVVMTHPDSVAVAPEVDPRRIAAGVRVHPGCRLLGAALSAGPGCEIGAETPATVDNCQLESRVALRGGWFQDATFLDGSSVGSAAHVRGGTLLEEEASAAHAVGLKQTILFPYVTLGSLINFCDCLMAGGTGRRDHGEVGSSYIHFNFTPYGDKATASLIGDVPRGVWLDQPPVFLGGQGGLVGPRHVAFGVVVPAGVILRQDVTRPGLWQPAPTPPAADRAGPARPGAARAVRRLVWRNLVYLGSIHALRAWYRAARAPFLRRTPFQQACLDGALARLDTVWQERVRRLDELAGAMPGSLAAAKAGGADLAAEPWRGQQALADHWPALRDALAQLAGSTPTARERERDRLLAELGRMGAGTSYRDALRALPAEARAAGTAWLQALVEEAVAPGAPITTPAGTPP